MKIIYSLCVMFLFVGCNNQQVTVSTSDPLTLNEARNFSLVNSDNKPFNLSDIRGKKALLFFGYLSCPDVCPTTLARLSKTIKLMGAASSNLEIIFISVDPGKDKPEKIKEYLSYFKFKSIGLTGSKEQIDEVVKRYGAVYEHVPSFGGDYTVDHTDYVYLIDEQGYTRKLFHHEDSAQAIADYIIQLKPLSM